MLQENLESLKKRDPALNASVESKASMLKQLKIEAAKLSKSPSCNISYKNSNNNLTLFNEDLVMKMVQSQQEFYQGDPNLKKDRFLQDQCKKSKKGYVDQEIFLKFNRIREIFMDASISDQKKKQEMIANAGEMSQLLKINKIRNRIKRLSKFDFGIIENEVEKSNTDSKTVYVENLPLGTNLEHINQIFNACRDIVHISQPKHHNKQIKGFGFIEFASEDSVLLALEKDNSVPSVLQNIPSNLDTQGLPRMIPLKVITKIKWLEYKKLYKECKNELLLQQQESLCSENDQLPRKPNEQLQGCLIRLLNIPKGISKPEIAIKLKNYKQPCFIDYIAGSSYAIVRFYVPGDKFEFLESLKVSEGLINEVMMKSSTIKIEELNGQEEIDYLEKVRQKKTNFKKHTKK